MVRIKPILKKIYQRIKKYNKIIIARHIGPDPDAICSQLALRDSLRLSFPNKKIYAVGAGVSRFKIYGILDKLPEDSYDDALLIVLDVPNFSRIDGIDPLKCKEIIKIDHHPYEDKMGEIEYVNTDSSSTCQMVTELILEAKSGLNKIVANNLFCGIVSDSERFLLPGTTAETFELVSKLIKLTNIDFISLYPNLYERPLSEIKFQGYLSENLVVSENGLAHVIISDEIIKEYGVDTSTASNMVNSFNFIREVLVWVFITQDEKNDVYKINIRSKGPVINTVATEFNGGGHKFASGIKTTDKREIDNIIAALDKACKEYKDSINGDE